MESGVPVNSARRAQRQSRHQAPAHPGVSREVHRQHPQHPHTQSQNHHHYVRDGYQGHRHQQSQQQQQRSQVQDHKYQNPGHLRQIQNRVPSQYHVIDESGYAVCVDPEEFTGSNDHRSPVPQPQLPTAATQSHPAFRCQGNQREEDVGEKKCMSHLLNKLKSEVLNLRDQGSGLDDQMWLLYSKFEDFVQRRHPSRAALHKRYAATSNDYDVTQYENDDDVTVNNDCTQWLDHPTHLHTQVAETRDWLNPEEESADWSDDMSRVRKLQDEIEAETKLEFEDVQYLLRTHQLRNNLKTVTDTDLDSTVEGQGLMMKVKKIDKCGNNNRMRRTPDKRDESVSLQHAASCNDILSNNCHSNSQHQTIAHSNNYTRPLFVLPSNSLNNLSDKQLGNAAQAGAMFACQQGDINNKIHQVTSALQVACGQTTDPGSPDSNEDNPGPISPATISSGYSSDRECARDNEEEIDRYLFNRHSISPCARREQFEDSYVILSDQAYDDTLSTLEACVDVSVCSGVVTLLEEGPPTPLIPEADIEGSDRSTVVGTDSDAEEVAMRARNHPGKTVDIGMIKGTSPGKSSMTCPKQIVHGYNNRSAAAAGANEETKLEDVRRSMKHIIRDLDSPRKDNQSGWGQHRRARSLTSVRDFSLADAAASTCPDEQTPVYENLPAAVYAQVSPPRPQNVYRPTPAMLKARPLRESTPLTKNHCKPRIGGTTKQQEDNISTVSDIKQGMESSLKSQIRRRVGLLFDSDCSPPPHRSAFKPYSKRPGMERQMQEHSIAELRKTQYMSMERTQSLTETPACVTPTDPMARARRHAFNPDTFDESCMGVNENDDTIYAKTPIWDRLGESSSSEDSGNGSIMGHCDNYVNCTSLGETTTSSFSFVKPSQVDSFIQQQRRLARNEEPIYETISEDAHSVPDTSGSYTKLPCPSKYMNKAKKNRFFDDLSLNSTAQSEQVYYRIGDVPSILDYSAAAPEPPAIRDNESGSSSSSSSSHSHSRSGSTSSSHSHCSSQSGLQEKVNKSRASFRGSKRTTLQSYSDLTQAKPGSVAVVDMQPQQAAAPPKAPSAAKIPTARPTRHRSHGDLSSRYRVLSADESVRENDIVDMDRFHTYTVGDVLSSFRQLSKDLPRSCKKVSRSMRCDGRREESHPDQGHAVQGQGQGQLLQRAPVVGRRSQREAARAQQQHEQQQHEQQQSMSDISRISSEVSQMELTRSHMESSRSGAFSRQSQHSNRSLKEEKLVQPRPTNSARDKLMGGKHTAPVTRKEEPIYNNLLAAAGRPVPQQVVRCEEDKENVYTSVLKTNRQHGYPGYMHPYDKATKLGQVKKMLSFSNSPGDSDCSFMTSSRCGTLPTAASQPLGDWNHRNVNTAAAATDRHHRMLGELRCSSVGQEMMVDSSFDIVDPVYENLNDLKRAAVARDHPRAQRADSRYPTPLRRTLSSMHLQWGDGQHGAMREVFC